MTNQEKIKRKERTLIIIYMVMLIMLLMLIIHIISKYGFSIENLRREDFVMKIIACGFTILLILITRILIKIEKECLKNEDLRSEIIREYHLDYDDFVEVLLKKETDKFSLQDRSEKGTKFYAKLFSEYEIGILKKSLDDEEKISDVNLMCDFAYFKEHYNPK